MGQELGKIIRIVVVGMFYIPRVRFIDGAANPPTRAQTNMNTCVRMIHLIMNVPSYPWIMDV